ncbi:MAG: LysR family transcriptional regulator [Burkholderiales bacterium]
MNTDKTDLHLLMGFDALAAAGSVSGAAQRMGLTQPAMSNLLARLRARYGDALFVRTRAGMSPTPKALELMQPVRDALDGVARVLAPAGAFDPRTSRAKLTLTATDYIEFVLMPRLVQSLEKRAPGIELEIRVANREMAGLWLSRGEIDFRIGWVRRPPAELRFKKLYTDRFVCMVRRDHPVVRGALTLDDYCSLRHVRAVVHSLPESGPTIDEAVAVVGRRVRVGVVSHDFLTLPFIVAQSDLVATVPERLARAFAKTLPLRILPPPVKLPELAVTLYWHERTQRSPLHRWFRELAGEMAAKL